MTDARARHPVRGAASVGASPATSEVLRRAEGVQLIGELTGSGYRVPPSLVRRGDGQTVQLTPLLYLTLEAIDGRRGYDEVAAHVSERSGRTVSSANVRTFVTDRLRPLGLLARVDGSQPELKRSDPLLGLRCRCAITDPERTRRLTAPFALLFHPLVLLPVLAGFAVVCWWVLFEKGLARATYEAFQHPGLLILVFVVTVLSAGFHEFGHAAAARYGGATPGVMGAGLYLVWPAFYTDVTDSYRLGRAGRVRTDLGGLYFNAVVAVAVTGVWWMTQYDALLLVVATQILQMLQQLTPLVRFDGYHVLADVTGVPDLFHRIRPTLLGALPWRWGDPEARLLKPWARLVVTLWVVVVVPTLAFAAVMMVLALPRLIGTAWARLGDEQDLLAAATASGDLVQAAARLLTMAAIVLPVAGIVYLLVRLGRQAAVSTWSATRDRPVARTVAGFTAAALAAGLVWAWWPDARTYRPIQPHERGTITDAVAEAVQPVSGAIRRPAVSQVDDPEIGLQRGDVGSAVTVWDGDGSLPTADEPRPAVIIVPRAPDPVDSDEPPPSGSASNPTEPAGVPAAEPTGAASAPPPTAVSSAAPEVWVFPFDRPLAPGPGDNQALAVNTTDDTVQYDVAFAMIWVDGTRPALNTNEAYAFASCQDCASVAIAFQVVMVIGDNDLAVPKNLAGAVNFDCVNCLTYALAQQLFVTLDGPLSETAMAQLDAIWAAVQELGAGISGIPLDEIDDRLDLFEAQILAVIETDRPGTLPSLQPSATGSAPPGEVGGTTPSLAPSDGSGASPPGASSATPFPSTDATPSGTASSGSTSPPSSEVPTPSGDPTPTESPTTSTSGDPEPDPSPSGPTTSDSASSGSTTVDSGIPSP